MSVSIVQQSNHNIAARFTSDSDAITVAQEMLGQNVYYYDQENNRKTVFKEKSQDILSSGVEEKFGVGGEPTPGGPGESMHTSICANCNASITDRYKMRVHPNLEFHVDCLTCCCCKRPLNESRTTFVRASKTYCKEDYYKEFGKRCTRCRIVLEPRDKIMRARASVFHQKCFSCSSCETLLNVGDYYIMRDDEIFCRPECVGALSLKMQQQTYFNKTQYYAMECSPFMTPQDKCQMPIPVHPSMPSHLAKNGFSGVEDADNERGISIPTTSTASFDYHMPADYVDDSFMASGAGRTAPARHTSYETSEDYSHGGSFLDDDVNAVSLRHKTHSSMSTSSGANSPYSNPDSVTAPSSINSGCVVSTGHTTSGTSTSTTASVTNQVKKTKKDKPAQRVRTVLNDGQLKILKQMYSNNQRPDQAVKEHLVEMTGLSARVIRVWFQNKRCKDKKKQNAMKEQQQNHEKEQTLQGVRLNGVGPLVAKSPIIFMHDALGMNGAALKTVDIRAFPQNQALWDGGPHAGGALSPFPPTSIDSAQHHQRSLMMHNMIGPSNNGHSDSSYVAISYASGGYLPSPLDVPPTQAHMPGVTHDAATSVACVKTMSMGDDDTLNSFLSHSPRAE